MGFFERPTRAVPTEDDLAHMLRVPCDLSDHATQCLRAGKRMHEAKMRHPGFQNELTYRIIDHALFHLWLECQYYGDGWSGSFDHTIGRTPEEVRHVHDEET